MDKGQGLRCERLSLLTFFAAAKKVSAAPHRGNARAARRIADASDSGKTQPASRMPAKAAKHRTPAKAAKHGKTPDARESCKTPDASDSGKTEANRKANPNLALEYRPFPNT
ncbi:hypothetical protein J8I87_23855 [Paraburkholderia sp. LEh10]|uniref:hypothetical protein n=1 Tax=Paraburkholderia sp. LEh10 TaxID=2821353 RepID=UPI001AE74E7B|nr:hypothetical protein [Paraburkholderia sp. LEh10]MBP0592711.1 hypothetical protein [Paraburkholderia sp. LEh10]